MLPPPQNLQIIPGDGNLTLSWEPPIVQTGLTGYRLQRFNGATLENTWDLGLDDPREIRDTDLINETLYTYHVAARNDAGFGEITSAEATPSANAALAPDAPGSPEIFISIDSPELDTWNINLHALPTDRSNPNWSDGNSPIDTLKLYRRPFGDQQWTLIWERDGVTANTNYQVNDNALPAGIYEYAASVTNEAGLASPIGQFASIEVGSFWIRQNLHDFLDGTDYRTSNPVGVLDMHFIDHQVGFALLEELASSSLQWTLPAVDRELTRIRHHVLCKTTDGGLTWTPFKRVAAIQNVIQGEYAAGWNWLHFSDSQNGLMVSTRNSNPIRWAIVLTEDGGLAFNPPEIHRVDNEPNQFISDILWDYRPEAIRSEAQGPFSSMNHSGNNVYIGGSGGTLLRRLNGGPFESIALASQDQYISHIDTIAPDTFFYNINQPPFLYFSNDSGENISPFPAPPDLMNAAAEQLRLSLKGFAFKNANIGHVAGTIDGQSFIWKTEDAGQNWIECDLRGQIDLRSITSEISFSWIGEQTVFAMEAPTARPKLWKSIDGGITWFKHGMLPSLESGFAPSSRNSQIYAVGNTGRLIYPNGISTIYIHDSGIIQLPAPQNFQIIPGDGNLTLSWEPPIVQTGLTGYRLQRFNGETLENTWDLGLDDPREIRDTDLINGVLYTYTVATQTSLGEGQEATAQATPQVAELPINVPIDLKAVPTANSIQLTWNHLNPIDLDGFELNRVSDGIKDLPVMLPPDAISYLDDQISPGQTAIYYLEAIKGNRKSESVSVEITMPELPPEPIEKPRIVNQSGSVEGGTGATVQLFVDATGGDPLQYTWFFNGQKMPNVTQPGIQIVNLSNEHVGNYIVEVSNAAGKVLSRPMLIEINPANRGGVDIAWDTRFENDEGFDSKPVGAYHSATGGALVAGEFTPNGSNNSDLLVVEYDANGNQLWATRASFSDTSQEFARKSIQDNQGNVIVGGSSLVNPADLVDEVTPDLPKGPIEVTFLASIGKSGNTNWTFMPPVDFEEEIQILDLQSDNSGKLYLLGNTTSQKYNGMVIQTLSSNNGVPSDPILADPESQFMAIAMAVSNNNRIYLVGNSNETDGAASGLQVRCYRNNGQLDWKTDLGSIGVNNFSPSAIHLHDKGGVYVVGVSNSPETAADIHVVRFDSSGSGEWQNTLGLPGKADDILIASKVDGSGALIVTGDSTYPGQPTQITLGKFLTDGNAAWSIVLPTSMPKVSDHVTDMDLDNSGNIYLSAIRHAPETGQDFASFRFSSDGTLIWEASFKQEGFAIEQATHIDADEGGNVILCGVTFLEEQQQIVTIRQTPVAGLENKLPELKFNDKPFRNPVVAPGQWTVELEATDPDGEITKVEFLEGAKVLATDTEAPYTLDFVSDTATTTRIFARAYDDLGGVAISDVLTIVVVETPKGAPIGVLTPSDSFLPAGSDLTLDFGITGADPIRYQWFLNGEKLKGADQPTLPLLPNVTRENSGSYVLRAENREGKLFTEPVIVSLDWQVVDGADQFEDATAIGGSSGFVRTSNTTATLENGEPRHSNKRSGNTIWYRWRPDTSGLATVSLQGSSFDTLLAVYAGPTLSQLTEIESDDDRGGFSTSRLQFNAAAGVDYMIAIGGFNGANGNILFSWELDAAQLVSVPRIRISPEKNTVTFGNPYQLTTSISGNLQGIQLQWFHNGAAIPDATGATLDIASAQPGDAGVYWITINAGGASGRTKPGHLTVNIPRRDKIIRELVLEEKFADLFFFVQDFNPVPQFQPQVFGSPFRSAAASLATGFTGAQIFNTFGATKEVGEPDHCGIPGGASQWFAYEAPADGELTITTDGSDFDTVMAIYTSTGSSFDDLTEVICDNDGGTDGQDSTVTFNAISGTIYYVAVDGVEAATGTVNLAYELEVGLAVQSVTLAEEGMQFEVQTVPNITFVIEGTEDFVTWIELISTSSLDGSFIYLDNEALTGTQRFYRVYVTE